MNRSKRLQRAAVVSVVLGALLLVGGLFWMQLPHRLATLVPSVEDAVLVDVLYHGAGEGLSGSFSLQEGEEDFARLQALLLDATVQFQAVVGNSYEVGAWPVYELYFSCDPYSGMEQPKHLSMDPTGRLVLERIQYKIKDGEELCGFLEELREERE